MNYPSVTRETGWDITWSDHPEKAPSEDSDTWDCRNLPLRRPEPEESEQHEDVVLVRNFWASLEKRFARCCLGDSWRELQEKWQPYLIHLTCGFAVARAEETPALEEVFNGLVDSWTNDTGGYSVTSRRYAHPSYQAIVGMGKAVVPLILRRLEQHPDWWFEALTALAKPKTNPVRKGSTFSEAVDAWLEWGRRNQLIS